MAHILMAGQRALDVLGRALAVIVFGVLFLPVPFIVFHSNREIGSWFYLMCFLFPKTTLIAKI